jgi:hypothetical protein
MYKYHYQFEEIYTSELIKQARLNAAVSNGTQPQNSEGI